MKVKTDLKAGNLLDLAVDELKREALAAESFIRSANFAANQMAANVGQSASSIWNSLVK
jgi:hypothetical protein